MKRSVFGKSAILLVPVLVMLLLTMVGSTARAEDAQWRARFWNNKNFSGDPVLERTDRAIDFDWGGGSPHPNISDDNFSARWNRTVNFAPGTYRFFATMDDAMRVYLDNQLIIDSWTDSQEHTITKDLYVSGGEHTLKVEYYEAGGVAVARFSWQLIQAPGSAGTGGGNFYPNWRGEYYNNTTLSGAPALVRDDRYLNHNWGEGSPEPGIIGNDFFSARWTKTLIGTPGYYSIIMTSDDGSRLYVNDQLVIDNWGVQAPTTRSAGYYYSGGSLNVRVEYFEQTESAMIEVHLGQLSTGGGGAITPPSGTGACPTITGNRGYVNTGSLNFREGPSVEFAVIATLPRCSIVGLTGFRNPVEASTPWVQVTLDDGRTAWASANYMVLGQPLEQMTVLSD